MVSAGLARQGAIFDWERDLLGWIQACTWHPVDGILRSVSSLGDGWTPVLVVTLAVLALRRYYEPSVGFLMAGGIVSGNALNALFKMWVGRPRPEVELSRLTDLPGGFGFPSGHVFLSVAFFGFIGILAGRHGSPTVRRAGLALALGFIAVMGVARVWLGAHWPLDVVGGCLLGGSWLWLMHKSHRVLKRDGG